MSEQHEVFMRRALHLARSVWGRVPDEGARGLDARLVSCDDLPPPGDVDTREG